MGGTPQKRNMAYQYSNIPKARSGTLAMLEATQRERG
jgi:hypothetical protein